MTARTPKLDPVWMEALGFVLLERPNIAALQWRNEGLDIQLTDLDSPKLVLARYNAALERYVTRRNQVALREVLLPAMGLEEHSEYDNYGSGKRTYIRPE